MKFIDVFQPLNTDYSVFPTWQLNYYPSFISDGIP